MIFYIGDPNGTKLEPVSPRAKIMGKTRDFYGKATKQQDNSIKTLVNLKDSTTYS